jgi:hypothetical protein
MVMKKSKAILSLSEKLQKSQNLLDGYKNGSIRLKHLCDNLATRAVDYCENELKMLPPFVDQYESDTSLDLVGNRWEPEDEE